MQEVENKINHQGRVPQGATAFFVALLGHGRKGEVMPKYFLSGTKYEAFERMMMETPRHYPAETENQSKSVPPAKGPDKTAESTERSE